MCFLDLGLARINSNMKSGAANLISGQMFENLNPVIWRIFFFSRGNKIFQFDLQKLNIKSKLNYLE